MEIEVLLSNGDVLTGVGEGLGTGAGTGFGLCTIAGLAGEGVGDGT